MRKLSLPESLCDALKRRNISTSETLIVAVSGGCDSMVLLTLCKQCGLNAIAAHVNYGLRGGDSEADAQLVSEYCATHKITLEQKKVTEHDWNAHRGSTQEQARAIRYAWFNELLKKHGAARVLTAHHANDQTETMLMQFIRGGGGKSVYGMAADTGSLLRPLLSRTKNELLEYARTNHIPWREDLSNQSDAYTRNTIRHNLLPLIEQLNPGIHDDIQERSQRMHEEQELAAHAAQSLLQSLIQRDNARRELIALDALLATGVYHVLLWKWLQPAGFSSHTTSHIANHVETGTSTEAAWYRSETHEVCLQNGVICLMVARIENPHDYRIHTLPWTEPAISAFNLSLKARNDIVFTADPISQSLDAGKMVFPLVVRPWKEGDALKPLGSPGHQKVSDLLTQLKLPAWEKKDVLVLESNDTIAAVVGIRISDTFKITADTTECLHIQFREA